MGIKLSSASGSFSNLSLVVFGDGVDKKVVIDLDKAPVDLDFRGSYPAEAAVSALGVYDATGAVDPSFTASAAVDRNLLTIIFNNPPVASALPNTTNAGMAALGIEFRYRPVG